MNGKALPEKQLVHRKEMDSHNNFWSEGIAATSCRLEKLEVRNLEGLESEAKYSTALSRRCTNTIHDKRGSCVDSAGSGAVLGEGRINPGNTEGLWVVVPPRL
jgi:hypothetical protein